MLHVSLSDTFSYNKVQKNYKYLYRLSGTFFNNTFTLLLFAEVNITNTFHLTDYYQIALTMVTVATKLPDVDVHYTWHTSPCTDCREYRNLQPFPSEICLHKSRSIDD